jgi:hypothetical protein
MQVVALGQLTASKALAPEGMAATREPMPPSIRTTTDLAAHHLPP